MTYSRLRAILSHYWSWVKLIPRINSAKKNYVSRLEMVRKKKNIGEKIKVLFLVNENAKWKCQSVYDAMRVGDVFDPYIVLTRADIDWGLSRAEFEAKIQENYSFFASRGIECLLGVINGEPIDLRHFKPDVVFYQHPWEIAPIQNPEEVSKFALTCYVPYYLVCFESPWMDSHEYLHKFVWRYMVISETWKCFFDNRRHGFPIAGEIVGIGHPMLDQYSSAHDAVQKKDVIIYAPHWSIETAWGENFSTFLTTGRVMLEYAKKHTEYKWCFKPHPTLRHALIQTSGWSVADIDGYYQEWELLGEMCLSGDYPPKFMESYAMITDSSSFLMEYSAINRPLIRLVSKKCLYQPARPTQELFNSFYNVKTIEELYSTLHTVLELRQDPKRGMREKAIRGLGLCCRGVGEDIAHYINRQIG